MKRVLVILLVIGLLVSGAVTAVAEDQESSFQSIDVTEDLDDGPGDPAPCGGVGGGDGGSPG